MERKNASVVISRVTVLARRSTVDLAAFITFSELANSG